MFSLATIQRMNNVCETVKSRRRAVAMNKPSGHAKDAEKGRPVKNETRPIIYKTTSPSTVFTAEDLRDLGVRS